MTSPATSIGPEEPLKRAGELLAARRIGGLPVVAGGRVVGVVSQSDIVRVEEEAEAECVQRHRFVHGRRHVPADRRLVREAMSSPALTVDPQRSAVGAAWEMTRHDVDRLVVVANGVLVGVVTRSDLVRAFARSDEDVRREILEEVLPALSVSPDDVEVLVSNGEVTLRGDVEDEVEVRCVPHAVRSVLGVVAVTAELTPRHPHTPFDRQTARL